MTGSTTYQEALKFILDVEKGYVDDPNDDGGETNWGITDKLDGKVDGLIDVDGDGKGDVPVKRLTPAQAGIIYKRDFWNFVHGDQLPPALALFTFDMAVNNGKYRAVKFLQKACGVDDDGNIGNATITAAQKPGVLEKLETARIAFYKSLPKYPRFGKGWMNRVNKCIALCADFEQHIANLSKTKASAPASAKA